MLLAAKTRLDNAFNLVEERTGRAEYYAGNEFTAADIMMVFSLTTMRYFLPYDLAPLPNVRGYLSRIGAVKPIVGQWQRVTPEWPCCCPLKRRIDCHSVHGCNP